MESMTADADQQPSERAGARDSVPTVYRLLLLEIERRRRVLGISMERLSEVAGIADRAFSKYLHPDAGNGRIARWETLQVICDFLFADGLDVQLKPHRGGVLTAIYYKHQIEHIGANYNRKSQRDLMRQLSQKAAVARAKIPAAKGSAIAKKAAKARWRKPRVVELTGP
jgi:hypothetical protein